MSIKYSQTLEINNKFVSLLNLFAFELYYINFQKKM